MNGFIAFIRERGVVGLAVGFILGGAVSRLVAAIVTDVINPLIGVALGAAGELREASIELGPAVILWGDLLAVAIDFIVIAFVVYLGVKVLGLDTLTKK